MRILYFLIFLLVSLTSWAQPAIGMQPQITQDRIDNNIFTNLDEKNEAQYNENGKSITEFINENLQYPQRALSKKLEADIVLNFVVAKDGTLSEIIFPYDDDDDDDEPKYPDVGFKEEAMRIIKLTDGKWKPATYNGQPVRSRKPLTIEFKLPKK